MDRKERRKEGKSEAEMYYMLRKLMHLPQLPQQPLPTSALLLAAELNQELLGNSEETKKPRLRLH